MTKRRIHDGIIGLVITIGALLGYSVNQAWHLVPIAFGLTLFQSAFSGFCPLYFTLDKLGIGSD